jgi:hypothetical protein
VTDAKEASMRKTAFAPWCRRVPAAALALGLTVVIGMSSAPAQRQKKAFGTREVIEETVKEFSPTVRKLKVPKTCGMTVEELSAGVGEVIGSMGARNYLHYCRDWWSDWFAGR